MRLRSRNEVEKRLTLKLHAFVERQVNGGLDRAQGRAPSFKAAVPASVIAFDLVKDFRMLPGRVDLVIEVANPAERHVRIDDFACKRDGAFAQLSFLGERVDNAPFERLFGRKRRAGKNGLERIPDPAEPRQTLGTAGAGNEAELDFGKAEFRRGYGDAIMAHQRHFEPAAERRAMYGGDDRFGAAFQRRLKLGKGGAF